MKVNLPFECPQTQNLPFDSNVEFFQKWKGISHSKGNASRMWHFCPLMTKLPLKTKCYNLIIYLRSKSAFRLWWNMPSEGKNALSMPSECPQIFTVYLTVVVVVECLVWSSDILAASAPCYRNCALDLSRCSGHKYIFVSHQ